MSSKLKVVLTGGTGLLSSTGPLEMANMWDLEIWTRGYNASFDNVFSKTVDLESFDHVKRELSLSKPDVIIHTAGLTNIEKCESNQYLAYLSNVVTSKNVSRAASELGIKVVYLSTDQVLKDKENAREDELAFPINVYAKTKLEGEYETLKSSPDALILRVNFFTWGSEYRKSFLDFIVDNLRQKKEITLFDDMRFNPLPAFEVLRSINTLLSKEVCGIYNLVGNTRLSKYEFGLKVAEIFELDASFLKKGKLENQKHLAPRPKNLTLCNEKVLSHLEGFKELDDVLNYLKLNEDRYKDKLYKSISPSQPNKIHYGRQNLNDTDFDAVVSCLGSAYLTQGPRVDEFEKAIATYVGAKYAVAMCNWTAGLHMAMLAADVGPGDNVITTPLSFVASSNCALYVGATPHFVDIDPVTLNIDPVKLEKKCSELGNVKAIIPVHFTGAPCDMKEIYRIAKMFNAVVVEDAAHGLGGRYDCGARIGEPKYADMVGFSFHPVKNITTGEGGVLTTDCEEIYRKLLRIRSHGINKANDPFINVDMAQTGGNKNQWYYEMQTLGHNFRITDIQCALGLSQLSRFNEFHSRRVEIAQKYDNAFKRLKNIKPLQMQSRERSGNHLYVVRINFKELKLTRFELFELFSQKDILLHVHYIPITKQPYYQSFVKDRFEVVDDYYEHAITLPLFASMTDLQVMKVIDTVTDIIG